MIVETLHNDSWAKTYVLIDKSSKKAAIIDSVFGRHEQDLDFIQQKTLLLSLEQFLLQNCCNNQQVVILVV